ncbi:MAG: ATP-binding protein [Acidimicrobiales bacterium]|jgi:signal transduction histidine kinase
MTKLHLSVRARLTLFFVLAIAVVLTFMGIALVNLVHRSLVSTASTQVKAEMAMTRTRLVHQTLPDHEIILPMFGNVVVQVTNLPGTTVWAASSAISRAPVLAHPTPGFTSKDPDIQLVRTASTSRTLAQIEDPNVQSISTSRGPGLIYGFVYGGPIDHSETVLMVSVATSFPLLLLISGALIWMGIGLALAPVESIRRRVAAIAAEDLSQRVPTTGGDDEIARMANTLNEMLDRLESSSKFQQEFVSNASHELRSPLTTLLATVERATSDQSNADWNEVAETIMREGRRLDVIVDGLFWLARHDENQLESERIDVDLDDLLFEESQRVRAMSGLNVDTTGVAPTRVSGDPAMLKRMIRNVVDNAMRYATSELRFASFFAGSYGVVTVADDGEGIDVAESERLFERFVRSDPARSRTSGGTGLGLSIVTEIVTRHGGSARFVPVERGTMIELRILVGV